MLNHMRDTCGKRVLPYIYSWLVIVVVNKISRVSVAHKFTSENAVSHYSDFLLSVISENDLKATRAVVKRYV